VQRRLTRRVQQQRGRRPRLRRRDRIFWVWLSKLWSGWQSALLIVKPDTVFRWHRVRSKYSTGWIGRRSSEAEEIVRVPCGTTRGASTGPLDIIGGVHGCLDEFVEQSTRLG
jgi:hypothetical protein